MRDLSFRPHLLCWGFLGLAAVAAGCSDSGGSTEQVAGAAGSTTTPTAGSGGSAGSPTGGNAGSVAVGGSGGSSAGSATGGNAGTGGSAVAGTDAGGEGGAGDDELITSPEGTIPNAGMPTDMLDLPKDDWKKGLVSPTLEKDHHQNQPIVVNGYLQGAGNAEIVFYDIADPKAPKLVSRLLSPNFDPKAGPKGVGEAESHQTSLARYGNKFYQVTTAGKGVDIWDISNVRAPRHVKSVDLEGVNYGDFTDAVWGMYWQGSTIYVGGTNTGLHILDAKDPEDVTFVKKLPTSAFGGVSAGPLWAVGNVLVITTPKESGGIATLDISDPYNPVALDFIKPSKGYIGSMYGHYAFLLSPLRAWDVLTDPTNIGEAATPYATLADSAFTAKGYSAKAEYMSFADNHLYLGHLRPEAGVSKINVSKIKEMKIERRVWGRLEFTNGDDQFSIQIGSLVALADDELPYRGMVIAAHSKDPDTAAPAVDTVIPKNGATGQNKKSRIGISFTDNLELATVHPESVIVRPEGGAPLNGTFGLYMGFLAFDPDEDLKPNTKYEVVLPKGGVKDLVGNGIAAEFKSTFTTGP
jgi:hypothetical protein